VVAYDFMELLVPWMGFGAPNEVEVSQCKESTRRKVQGPVEATRKIMKEWFGSD
jgi:hypothetical protein